METSLAIYDSMIAAIDRCHQVDEVKDIRDQARALETYAKQALNTAAERKAVDVRIRAERRAGQLLKEMERGEPGRPEKNGVHAEPNLSPYQEAKQEANISDTQAKRWQKLAEIPTADFEYKLQDPLVKPSTSGIIESKKPRQAPDEALWLWGRLRDFERDFISLHNINDIVAQMSDALQNDVRRIAPQLECWLGEMEK